jgi:PAS domain S-box-containing protein/excisionase family DNA binding protein
MKTTPPVSDLPTEHLSVAEAAELLGVSPSTLRNWDRSGKLKPVRHPLNKYRIYSRAALEAVRLGAPTRRSQNGMPSPRLAWHDLGAREHFVQFYESDAHLVDSVAAFATKPLQGAEGVILIATAGHLKRIEQELEVRGVDAAEARAKGQYVALDAAETLDKFMVGNLPDPTRFTETIGGVISALAEKWAGVRAFGEMVSLLCAAGNREGAIRLEELWNELGAKHAFSLFCAYPMNLFSGPEDARSFGEVCACHSIVIPSETYTSLSTAEEQLREISALQQKAAALEAEITLRRQAEAELADFVENAIEGLHKVGPDGIILWANKAELNMLGYDEEEYIGHHVSEFHVGGDVAADILHRLSSGQNVLNCPARLRRKDGSIRHVLIHSNGCYKDGKLVFTRCFTRDITERKMAERDQAWLAAIVDTSDDAIISKDLDGIITSWNKAAERLFGYSAQEAIGRPLTMLIPEDRFNEEPEILSRIRRGERIDHYETVRRRKDGTQVEISLTVSPVVDGNGQPIGASKIARDITERREAEARHRLSEERYRRLAELMPVAVYTCEAPSGAITYFNHQAEVLWGRAPKLGDDSERYCGSLKLWSLDGNFLAHDECPMARAIQRGQSYRNQEVLVERPDGSRVHVLVNIEPIRNESGQITGAINVFLDMTALKAAEAALREAARRKDEFLATMAHELRNPLAPIRHILQLLQLSENVDPEIREMHEIIERQSNHMVRLVDDLLELSRISRGNIELKKETLDLKTLVAHALEASTPSCESAAHKVTVSIPDEPIAIEGDPVRLVQVFTNLMNNAAKYSENGGTIQVRVERHETEARVSIKDSGIGIPPGMMPRLFEMFAQIPSSLGRSQGGLGIGLHLVKNLVQMHGGTVEGRSEGVGHGSEFMVRLPVAASNGGLHVHMDPSPARELYRAVSHRILLVDDNKDAANSLAKLLGRLHMNVHVAHDGHSALEVAPAICPSVVVLDIGLPDISGYEVAKRLRSDAQFQDVMLIALTGWGQREDRRRSKEAGFDHHLVKPIEFKKLLSLLNSERKEPQSILVAEQEVA